MKIILLTAVLISFSTGLMLGVSITDTQTKVISAENIKQDKRINCLEMDMVYVGDDFCAKVNPVTGEIIR